MLSPFSALFRLKQKDLHTDITIFAVNYLSNYAQNSMPRFHLLILKNVLTEFKKYKDES